MLANRFLYVGLFFLAVLIVFNSIYLPGAVDTLIYIRNIDAMSLDPGKSRELYSHEVTSNIFEGLVAFSKKPFVIIPCLSTHWEVSKNGEKWIFHLRKGVTFHNGEIFDASSVFECFNTRMKGRTGNYKKWKYLFPFFKNIRIIDPNTIEIILSKSSSSFLYALTKPAAYITAPASYKGSEFIPVGTGPFKFEQWKKGDSLILNRNKNYWETNAGISRVIFKVIPGAVSKILQIKRGNADVSIINSSKEYEELLGKKEIGLLSITTPRVQFLAFNTRRPPFNRIPVRRAFSHLINKKAMVRHNFQGLAIPAVTPIPPHISGFNKDIKNYEYNLNKAREILKNAGLAKGFSCTLYFSGTNPALRRIVNNISKNAKAVNILIIKKPVPFKQLIERVNRGEHDMVIMGWQGAPDPDSFLFPLFTMTKGNNNPAFYSKPDLTTILKKARESLFPEQQNKYIQLAQEIIHRDSPWVPLYHLKNLAVFSKKVKNLYFSPYGFLIFKNIIKEE